MRCTNTGPCRVTRLFYLLVPLYHNFNVQCIVLLLGYSWGQGWVLWNPHDYADDSPVEEGCCPTVMLTLLGGQAPISTRHAAIAYLGHRVSASWLIQGVDVCWISKVFLCFAPPFKLSWRRVHEEDEVFSFLLYSSVYFCCTKCFLSCLFLLYDVVKRFESALCMKSAI